MKTCPVCGIDYDDLLIFCEEDGARLVGAEAYREQLASPPPPSEAATLPLTPPAPADETSSLRQCPACAAEYPLTFTNCPVDGVPLAARRVQPRPAPLPEPAAARASKDPAIENRFATIPFNEEEIGAENVGDDFESEEWTNIQSAAPPHRSEHFADRDAPVVILRDDLQDEPIADEVIASPDDGRGYRLAARALAAFVAAVGLMGLFLLLSHDRPAASTANAGMVGAVEPPQESVFVPTPVSESEEALAEEESAREEATSEATAPPPRFEKPAPQIEKPEREAAKPKTEKPRVEPRESTRQAAVRAAEKATPARVDARLVRVRSRKSPQGMRYDLTFTLQEKNGRPIRWERLAINARSRSGKKAAKTIPFPRHSGGPSRATFTVTTDMPGRTAADWRGRIDFTGIGRDAAGRPVRAAFGTNVTP